MSKKDKPKSRWNKGGTTARYTPAQQRDNDKVLREGKGWHRGARVR